MWVFTNEGFFSVVWDHQCSKDELMIRTRCIDDIIKLSKKIWGYCDESQIFEALHADYRFRMKISKQMWAEYLSQCALNLDYANVKESIVPPDDPLRKEAYYQLWEDLYRWQSNIESEEDREKQGGTAKET